MGGPTRRMFSAQQKLEIVMALMRGEKQLTALAREHGVDHTTIYRWRDQMQSYRRSYRALRWSRVRRESLRGRA